MALGVEDGGEPERRPRPAARTAAAQRAARGAGDDVRREQVDPVGPASLACPRPRRARRRSCRRGAGPRSRSRRAPASRRRPGRAARRTSRRTHRSRPGRAEQAAPLDAGDPYVLAGVGRLDHLAAADVEADVVDRVVVGAAREEDQVAAPQVAERRPSGPARTARPSSAAARRRPAARPAWSARSSRTWTGRRRPTGRACRSARARRRSRPRAPALLPDELPAGAAGGSGAPPPLPLPPPPFPSRSRRRCPRRRCRPAARPRASCGRLAPRRPAGRRGGPLLLGACGPARPGPGGRPRRPSPRRRPSGRLGLPGGLARPGARPPGAAPRLAGLLEAGLAGPLEPDRRVPGGGEGPDQRLALGRDLADGLLLGRRAGPRRPLRRAPPGAGGLALGSPGRRGAPVEHGGVRRRGPEALQGVAPAVADRLQGGRPADQVARALRDEEGGQPAEVAAGRGRRPQRTGRARSRAVSTCSAPLGVALRLRPRLGPPRPAGPGRRCRPRPPGRRRSRAGRCGRWRRPAAPRSGRPGRPWRGRAWLASTSCWLGKTGCAVVGERGRAEGGEQRPGRRRRRAARYAAGVRTAGAADGQRHPPSPLAAPLEECRVVPRST